jgi:hypothetical protein
LSWLSSEQVIFKKKKKKKRKKRKKGNKKIKIKNKNKIKKKKQVILLSQPCELPGSMSNLF